MYTILKGFHRCLALPWVVRGCKLQKTLRFSESCKYDLGTEDQYDWNKLVGFTFGLIGPKGRRNPVHWNSVRVGWRYDLQSKMFEISAYCYSDGARLDAPVIGKFPANQSFSVELIPDEIAHLVHFRINGKIVYSYEVPDSARMNERAWGWKLRPFFGGNRKAPHKIVIRQNDI